MITPENCSTQYRIAKNKKNKRKYILDFATHTRITIIKCTKRVDYGIKCGRIISIIIIHTYILNTLLLGERALHNTQLHLHQIV